MLGDKLNETQTEIKRWIHKLDQFVIGKEAIWGIGNLQKLVSSQTAEKMEKQNEKLTTAIQGQDIRAVQDLVNGTIRGYEVMEKEARKLGHAPLAPECMEVRLEDGFTLRVARNATEARSTTEEGVYVWTLQEIARVIRSDYTLVNEIRKHLPQAELKKVDKIIDDEIPW